MSKRWTLVRIAADRTSAFSTTRHPSFDRSDHCPEQLRVLGDSEAESPGPHFFATPPR